MSAIPEVSVVFATHDRAERVAMLIESLRRQTIDRSRFEVIAVDDGSRDHTPRVLAEAAERGDLDLRVMRRETAEGPASARNQGWRGARAPLIAFTDDDCVASPGWLEAGLAALKAEPGCFVQGRTDPSPDEVHLLGPFSRTLRVHELGPF